VRIKRGEQVSAQRPWLGLGVPAFILATKKGPADRGVIYTLHR
jgi:hypothetical protein